MLWWIFAGVVWLFSAACIFLAMADVIRGKARAFSTQLMAMYCIHGVTAVAALYLVIKAMDK